MAPVADDRRQLRRTFDTAARLYQQARPQYPAELLDALERLAGLRPGDRLLEIGCATGTATAPLARRGFRITAVELGAHLAELARRRLAGLGAVEVIEADFETWQPAWPRFDLVFAATAWHWIDPARRYQRAWELLRPGGHLAFWSALQVVPEGGDPFFDDIQDAYNAISEGRPAEWRGPGPGELRDERAEMTEAGLFGAPVIRHFDWEIRYTAAEYLALLSTFSSHIAMSAGQREHLYGEITRRLAERPGGQVRHHWGAALHVARRLDPPV